MSERGKGSALAEQGNESGAARQRQSANLSGLRKAAVLLVAVGEELAKEILRALPEADVQRLTEELADLRGITPELSAEVLEEFWELLETQNFMVHGGLDYASRLLIETFGKERADDLLMHGAPLAGGGAGQSGQAAAHRSAATGQAARLRASADHRAGAGASRPAAGVDGAGQSERGAQGGLDPAAGGDAPVFAGDGAEGGAHSAPAAGERGRHGAQELLRIQGGGRSAEPAERRGVEEDSGDH